MTKKYENIKDGEYAAVIEKALIKVSAKGNKMASVWFRVAGQKSKAFGTYMLHNYRAKDTVKMLARAGLKATTPEEVETFIGTLEGADVWIRAYTSEDGFQNVEILNEPPISLDDEEIPF